MTNDQFLFWLWGAFKVSDPLILDEKSLNTIEAHIKLIEKENAFQSPFIHWLQGALDVFTEIDIVAYEVLTEMIYQKLKGEFERKAKTIEVARDRPILLQVWNRSGGYNINEKEMNRMKEENNQDIPPARC